MAEVRINNVVPGCQQLYGQLRRGRSEGSLPLGRARVIFEAEIKPRRKVRGAKGSGEALSNNFARW